MVRLVSSVGVCAPDWLTLCVCMYAYNVTDFAILIWDEMRALSHDEEMAQRECVAYPEHNYRLLK